MTPFEIKALAQKVNQELASVTDKFQSDVPLGEIMSILTKNGLDPKAFQNAYQHKDEGRLHVNVGQGIYLTMTWYKFESTGRYEIVAYASSQHDDVKTPAKPMDSGEKRKAMASVNAKLVTIGKTYWTGVGSACKAVSDALETAGFEATDFDHQAVTGTAGRKEGRIHAPVGNGVFLAFSFFKMDVTGKYEIVAYLS